jgi:hypothetical protein
MSHYLQPFGRGQLFRINSTKPCHSAISRDRRMSAAGVRHAKQEGAMNDAKSALESQDSREKWTHLVRRAATDNDLKHRLLTEPTPVLEAEGVAIPE